MEVSFQAIVEELSVVGFFKTAAPLYVDMMVLLLAILPILSAVSILFAIKRSFKLHQFTQFLLLFLTSISLGTFSYIFYNSKSFELVVQSSSIDYKLVVIALVIYAILATLTVVFWMFSLIYALSDKKRRALPGLYTQSHRRAGKQIFNGLLLMSLGSIGIYWMLFLA